MGWGMDTGWGTWVARGRWLHDALWEGHTLLKTGLSAHRHTDRHTKVKTVYPPGPSFTPFTWRI